MLLSKWRDFKEKVSSVSCDATHLHTRIRTCAGPSYQPMHSLLYPLYTCSTCTTYLGTVCKIYLGEAQIERSPGVDTITLNNITMARDALVAGGVTVNEGCLHFIIFSECVSTVQPCNGTVWCGQESKLQLLEIARQVCQCAGTEPCEEALSDFLASVNVATTYTQRSAAPAGTCQDTTLCEIPATYTPGLLQYSRFQAACPITENQRTKLTNQIRCTFWYSLHLIGHFGFSFSAMGQAT